MNSESDPDLSILDATNIVRRLTPEARDHMLLGFAVAEPKADIIVLHRDDDEWFATLESWSDGPMPYRESRAGTGPTPLAAVENALKEVRDA